MDSTFENIWKDFEKIAKESKLTTVKNVEVKSTKCVDLTSKLITKRLKELLTR